QGEGREGLRPYHRGLLHAEPWRDPHEVRRGSRPAPGVEAPGEIGRYARSGALQLQGGQGSVRQGEVWRGAVVLPERLRAGYHQGGVLSPPGHDAVEEPALEEGRRGQFPEGARDRSEQRRVLRAARL